LFVSTAQAQSSVLLFAEIRQWASTHQSQPSGGGGFFLPDGGT